ncbi:hypothetical protein GGTG_04743 [Gaeumannomyces tritici R3-111a-1]|uniref:Uncharacterized protein n=1 Tax=Gaeumannomyces tritici (strain R3-111a-1) TaxID=644352 RepID=J3NTZ4_GAET3|nr:hypothetical protein GGTG_04743 [Gaeumannomyces tritici R3-111a-1]EJT79659.1 hypothetical protein GGTG_04743 [Gaeumannomyces tritici R3-111a-1]
MFGRGGGEREGERKREKREAADEKAKTGDTSAQRPPSLKHAITRRLAAVCDDGYLARCQEATFLAIPQCWENSSQGTPPQREGHRPEKHRPNKTQARALNLRLATASSPPFSRLPTRVVSVPGPCQLFGGLFLSLSPPGHVFFPLGAKGGGGGGGGGATPSRRNNSIALASCAVIEGSPLTRSDKRATQPPASQPASQPANPVTRRGRETPRQGGQLLTPALLAKNTKPVRPRHLFILVDV